MDHVIEKYRMLYWDELKATLHPHSELGYYIIYYKLIREMKRHG